MAWIQRHAALHFDNIRRLLLTVTGVPNELLGASYQLYYHAGINETILRMVGYAIPVAHMETVAPTTAFTSTRLLKQTPCSRSGGVAAQARHAASGEPVNVLSRRADPFVNPSSLHSLYKMYAYVPAASGQKVLGIAGHRYEYPSQADLTAFITRFRDVGNSCDPHCCSCQRRSERPEPPNHGGRHQNPVHGAMAYPTPHIYYYTSNGGWVRILPSNGEPDPVDD